MPECTASERSPRLLVARPAPSFSPIRASAARTEKSAVRRGAVIERRSVRGASAHGCERPDHGVDAALEVTERRPVEPDRRDRREVELRRGLLQGPGRVMDLGPLQYATFVGRIQAVPLGEERFELSLIHISEPTRRTPTS